MIPINPGSEFDIGRWLTDNNPRDWGLFYRNVQASIELFNLTGQAGTGPVSCLQPWEKLPPLKLAAATPNGAFVEVGVFWGGFAYWLMGLAKKQNREIFLYDTFEGLPYQGKLDDPALVVGLLKPDEAQVRATLGDYPKVQKCVFPHGAEVPPKIAFAHIDVDQYQSTLETIVALMPYMAEGGVMWFDDSNTLEGARQAIRDVIGNSYSIDPTTGRWFHVVR